MSNVSERRSSRSAAPAAVVLFWATVAAIVVATLCPIELRPRTGHVHLERTGAFALGGLLAVLAYPKHSRWYGLGVVILAGGLELLQLIDPGRDGHLADAFEKIVGGLLGVGAGVIWMTLRAPATPNPGAQNSRADP